MDLSGQKAFYDTKRQFQGKDNPGAPHPDSKTREPMPKAQIAFGVIFLALIALMAWATMKSADPTHGESHDKPAEPAAAPKSPAAH